MIKAYTVGELLYHLEEFEHDQPLSVGQYHGHRCILIHDSDTGERIESVIRVGDD